MSFTVPILQRITLFRLAARISGGLFLLPACLMLGSTPAHAQLTRLPETEQAYNSGQKFLEEEKYEQAIDAFTKATQLDDSYAEAFLGLGEA